MVRLIYSYILIYLIYPGAWRRLLIIIRHLSFVWYRKEGSIYLAGKIAQQASLICQLLSGSLRRQQLYFLILRGDL